MGMGVWGEGTGENKIKNVGRGQIMKCPTEEAVGQGLSNFAELKASPGSWLNT